MIYLSTFLHLKYYVFILFNLLKYNITTYSNFCKFINDNVYFIKILITHIYNIHKEYFFY